jgi:20S proteasome alpha/beta subunit
MPLGSTANPTSSSDTDVAAAQGVGGPGSSDTQQGADAAQAAASESSDCDLLGKPVVYSDPELADAPSSDPGSSPPAAVAVGSGGLTINLLFDAAAQAAPASFRAGIEQAAAILSAAISDPVAVNLRIDYSGTGGGAAGGPDNGLYETYSDVRAALVNGASPGDTTFNALPTGSTFDGQSLVAVWNAQLKLFGMLAPNDTTTDDGQAIFSTDINPNLLVGVALHELTHAMGRVPYGPPYGPQPDIFDFDRFTSPGTTLIDGTASAPAAYFSLDGGRTKIADFGQASDSSDFLNSGVQGANDPFNEFYFGGTLQQLTAIDLEQLDALGFHLTANQPTVIEADGATSLVKVGQYFYMYPAAGSSGPQLKYQGNAVVAGQFSNWTPIAAEQTASGFEVAWRQGSSDLFHVWNTGSNGNFVSLATGDVSGESAALEQLESSFHQDLNGDGVIGPVVTTTESAGTTSLVQVGIDYFLGGLSGVELSYNGVPVAVGQFGGWNPIGTERTANGYEVAWKVRGADQYTLWYTDSSGNFLSDPIGVVSGGSTTLETLEQSFQQDLNGDGSIGPPVTTIESKGSTSLLQVGTNYLMGGVSGVPLKYAGAPVVVGQAGPWMPIGAEQTASGYEVIWKATGLDLFTVWNADSSGNFVSDTVGAVSGESATMELLESSFQQDLNGDGVTGPVATTVESNGAASLVQVGINYLIGGLSGVQLSYAGAPVAAGQLGGWTPIAAERGAVVWKVTGVDQYTVWNIDSSGNFVSDTVGVLAGSSMALELLEAGFRQDLNGDGVLGPVITTIAGSGATELTSVGTSYFLGGPTGVALKYGGAPVTAGQLGGWRPVAIAQAAGGFEVAWKVTGADQYTVWNTDGNGNFVSDTVGVVSGSSATLELLEPSFHQDLNGDGVTGPHVTTIETNGATSFAQVGINYMIGGLSGVQLQYGGAPVVAGQRGGWAPIAAEQMGSGYEVAWKVAGADQFTVWNTDGSGNFVSDTLGVVSGSNAGLQSLEPSFHQDLNGDGWLGIPPPVSFGSSTGATMTAITGGAGLGTFTSAVAASFVEPIGTIVNVAPPDEQHIMLTYSGA